MQTSDPEEQARLLADEARGYREGMTQFVNWARQAGPFGLDPETGF